MKKSISNVQSRIAAVLLLALTATTAIPHSSQAAIFLIAPVAWGGVIAGAGVMAGGVQGFYLSDKIQNKGAKVTAKVFSIALAVVGFLILDDESISPVLRSIPEETAQGELKEILDANHISASDLATYNREHLAYQGVIESVMNDPVHAKASAESKARALADAAREAGISSATIQVTGLIHAIAEKAGK